MADTTFIDKETVIEADWAQDVNDAIYGKSANLSSDMLVVATTGSLSRSHANRWGGFITPNDFLENTTPGTTDMTDAINLAIATGKCLFLEETYLTRGAHKIPSNVILTGQGWNSIVKLSDGANARLFENVDQSNGNSNITIENLKLDGNRTNQNSGINNGIFIDGSSTRSNNITLRRLWVTACYGSGIHPKNTDYLFVDNVLLDDNGIPGDTLRHNMYFLNNDYLTATGLVCRNPFSGRNCKITNVKNSYIQVISHNAVRTGVSLSDDSRNNELVVVSENDGASDSDGLRITSENSSSPSNCDIRITVVGAGRHGVSCRGNNMTIRGTARSCGGSGVNVGAAVANNVITGMMVRENDVGISIESGPTNTIVVGNTVTLNITENLTNAGSGNVIRDNAPDSETVTGTATLNPCYKTSLLSGAVTATLGSGNFVGDEKLVTQTTANSSTLSVTNHETSNPEVFTFTGLNSSLTLQWTSNQWVTIASTAVTV